MAKGAGVASLRGHQGRVLGVAWSSASAAVAFSASDDQSVRLWDLARTPSHTAPPDAPPAGDKKRKNKRAAPPDAVAPPAAPALPPAAAGPAPVAPPPRKAKKAEAPARPASAALFAQGLRSEKAAAVRRARVGVTR